jgi:hypothetical protein
LPELAGEPSVFVTIALKVLPAPPGSPRRIVTTSVHFPLYPTQIALIDAQGRTISEYWHSGWLLYLALADLDGTGHDQILASGVANGYRQATLVVLDPDHLSGSSYEPMRPELQIHGMGSPRERLRLLLPRSDLNLATETYNQAQDITVANGAIRVSVWECHQEACSIWYDFDQHFTLRAVYPHDRFLDLHREFYRNTKNKHEFSAEEKDQLWKVRCLVGCETDVVAVAPH